MDIEEKREKVALLHKYFSDSFWVSIILLTIIDLITFVTRDAQIADIKKYFQLSAKDWCWIVTFLISTWKILIMQFTLVPALVFWRMKRCCFKGECKM